MEDELDILRTLQTSVTAAVSQSDSPFLPVSYINVEFDTPNDGKWLELVWLPNNVQGDLWGQEKTHRGILRMILHWPNDGSGVYRPLGLLGSISRYFKNGMLLNGTQITSKADLTGAIFDADELLLPVSLRYQSYRKGHL